MFTTRQVPWMQKGTVLDVSGLKAREAIMLGGLDFDVLPQSAGYQDENGKWHGANGYVSLVRQDTDEVYGFASADYESVQYREAFEFMDQINPTYVAAGALHGGKQGFLVAELPDKFDLDLKFRGKEDPHRLYIILRTSQDKTRAIEIILTTLRGMCMNQLTLPSLKRGCEQMWSIRHTPNARERLEQAKNVLTRVDEYADAFAEIATNLADIDVDFDMANRTLHHVLPNRPRRDSQIESIMDSFNNSEAVGFPGTGWGLVNAVQGYFEWDRPNHLKTFESVFNGPLTGQAHVMAEQTVKTLLKA